jgi:hypothetical protein
MRPEKTDWSVSENGRVWSTASWARRTFAAATRRMASVIFCVLPTVWMRSRSSPPLPIWSGAGADTRCTAAGPVFDTKAEAPKRQARATIRRAILRSGSGV